MEEISKFRLESVLISSSPSNFLIYCEEMRRAFNRALPERLRPYAEPGRMMSIASWAALCGGIVLALIMGAMAAGLCLLLGISSGC